MKLNFKQCVLLLQALKENSFIQSDLKNPNNILVYRKKGITYPEGWYTQKLTETAVELSLDEESQEYLLEIFNKALKNKYPKNYLSA